jgi:hypothetical protein
MKSETIGKLAEALSKAQGEMPDAEKTGENPFFKKNGKPTKYATLSDVLKVAKPTLAKHGLSFVQFIEDEIYLSTLLLHISGEWISGRMKLLLDKATMQSQGSALSYARRYSLTSLLGIADEDDDGNEASGKKINGSIGEDFDEKKTISNDATRNDSGLENAWEITDHEIAEVAKLAEKLGWPMTRVTHYYQNSFGIEKFSQLTKQQFEKLCEELKDIAKMEETKKMALKGK